MQKEYDYKVVYKCQFPLYLETRANHPEPSVDCGEPAGKVFATWDNAVKNLGITRWAYINPTEEKE